MHLDTQKGNLDKLGQLGVSKFIVIKNKEIDLFFTHLDTETEEHIGEVKLIGLPAE